LIQVGFSQPIRSGIELGDGRAILTLERVEVSQPRTQRPVSGDDGLDVDLLAGDGQVRLLCAYDEGVGLGALSKRFYDRGVGLISCGFLAIGCRLMLQLVEIITPCIRHGAGIVKVGLVEFLDVWGVATKKVRSG